jgi:ubiquinone/menaquinone biosynthesis C-methylase UbiE
MGLDANQQAAQEQFDRQASRYGKSHILSDVSDIEEALGVILPAEMDPALDVATGGGHTASWLAARGINVTASDVARGMLEQASQLAGERGLTIRTAQHKAEELPYAAESFGLVTCRVAAHHFSSVASFLGEACRVLRPGGWLLVLDGAAPDDAPEAEEWIHRVEKLRDPSHGRFLTPARWSLLAREAGFDVVRCACAPFKQPDVEWYFETASTPEENRRQVMALVDEAPEEARRVFLLGREQGKVVWWWPRMTLLARRPEVAKPAPQT